MNLIKTPRWYHFDQGLGDLESFSVFLGLRISSCFQVVTCICQPVGDWFQLPESWLVYMCQSVGDWFPSFFLSLCLLEEWAFSVSYWVFLFLHHLVLSHAPPCFLALPVSLWEALLFLVWVRFGTSSSDADCSHIINFPYLAVSICVWITDFLFIYTEDWTQGLSPITPITFFSLSNSSLLDSEKGSLTHI